LPDVIKTYNKAFEMKKREFIGVTFKCCNVYARIYLNEEGTAFEGTCPRCYKKKISLKIVPKGGSSSRFFEVE